MTFSTTKKYGARKGLQGPFTYPNGRTLYYDGKEKKYYDPTTDFYLESSEVNEIQNSVFDILRK